MIPERPACGRCRKRALVRGYCKTYNGKQGHGVYRQTKVIFLNLTQAYLPLITRPALV